MREHVDLEVTVRGANAVEYTLRAPTRTISSWRGLEYALWLVAVASATSWHSQVSEKSPTWLYVALVAVAVACGLHVASGSVVIEESVLVVPSLGVQFTRRKRNGATTKQFLDASDITAVVINEGFLFSDVVYYIAFMVHSRDDLVLAFEHFRPRIAILQEIFVQMRKALFPDPAKMHLPHIE